jgi:uncharacterized membrane protein
MDEYVASNKKEKEISKKIRKKFKRWKVGRWFVLAIALLVSFSIINTAIRGADQLNGGFDGITGFIFAIIGFSLLPFIAMLIVYAISIGGGRDILFARSAEKVYLDSKQLRNVFTPNFKQVTNADSVEICVPYDKIREMCWNAELCRLEITAEYKYILFKNNAANEQVINNKPVILYGYFGSMEKMLNQIENYTNKKIIGRI